MTTRGQNWDWKLTIATSLGIGGVIASSFDCALAQITPDGTLSNNSIVTPQGNTSIINGGTTAGGNLFHSFEEFSVPTGSEASFNNAPDIQNILSRVTGESISNIDGLVRANGTANLFLLNPNGIIFGPNASLNIGGSFVGSTASSLNFADGTQFSATARLTTPLLTISVPVGLQYGVNPGRIQVQGDSQGIRQTSDLIDTTAGLRVQPNQTLALVGGDVALEGGTLKTAGGRIELGSVAGAGLVNLTPTNTGWALGYEGVPTFGDIQLSQQTAVDASGAGGGDVQVRGRRVTLSSGSQIEASKLEAEPSGTLSVTASESVELLGTTAESLPSGLFIASYPGATGTGGNLIIETGRLSVQNGAQIVSTTFGEGSAGTLLINAKESVELIGNAADSLLGTGLATNSEGAGAGGDLIIDTRQLNLRGDGAQVTASTSGAGAGGNLFIGTEQLSIQDGAQIGTGTFGEGSAGSLVVNAKDSVELSGTSADGRFSTVLATSVQAGATGAGGNLFIKTERLSIQDGARIGVSTFGEGSAGTLVVKAKDSVELSGTSADGQRPSLLTARTRGAGNAGNLKIETGQLSVRDRAQIGVSSEGLGSAGQLEITARSIRLDKQATLTATTRSGNGGNIKLQAQDLLMRRGSEISTTAGLTGTGGDGGNIDINTKFLVAVPQENSDISANAYEGRGGNIDITAQGIFGIQPQTQNTQLSDITASSEFGLDGVVELNTPDVDPSRGLVTLPTELVDLTQLIAQGCPAGVGSSASEFVVTEQGGLPPTPREALSSGETILEDWGDLALTYAAKPQNKLSHQRKRLENRTSDPAVSVNSASSEAASIVEATGWVYGPKGEVILTASAPTITPRSFWQTPVKCHGS